MNACFQRKRILMVDSAVNKHNVIPTLSGHRIEKNTPVTWFSGQLPILTRSNQFYFDIFNIEIFVAKTRHVSCLHRLRLTRSGCDYSCVLLYIFPGL